VHAVLGVTNVEGMQKEKKEKEVTGTSGRISQQVGVSWYWRKTGEREKGRVGTGGGLVGAPEEKGGGTKLCMKI